MADAVQQDKVGLQKEFEDAPAPQEEAPKQEPQEFIREIDLGDGGGKQVFKGKSWEEVTEKMAEAHVHATRKIRELSQERKAREPEKTSSDWQALKPQQANPQDAPLMENFRRLFQSEIGIPLDEFRQRENDRRRVEAEMWAQNEFVRKHPDYLPTPENAQKVQKFLERENLPLSRRNLEYAYEELRDQLAAKVEPQPSARNVQPEQPAPAAQPAAATRSTPPSFIRPSFGGPVEREGGGQEAEIARIAQSSSLPEMKARIEQYFRQLRTSAR
jgi:hypothetical protein